MRLIYQIPRNSLAWLLLSHVLVIIPHIPILPKTIVGLALLCLIWRIQVYRGIWSFPSRPIKYCLAVLNIVALYFGYGRLTGLEPMIALLIVGFSLKLVEMHQRKDALVVIYLAYLMAALQLLFSQTMTSTLLVVCEFTVITTALLGLNQSQGYRYPISSLRSAGVLILQSAPLMLLLFLVMPRVGALWSVPSPQHSAQTGVSDSMSPGDISSLTHNGDLAFRVSFNETIPTHSQRYWRGLVYSRFDGRRWSQAEAYDYAGKGGKMVRWPGDSPLPWQRALADWQNKIEYSVIMEPSRQPWLYALDLPVAGSGAGLAREFRLLRKAPVMQRIQYRVTSVTGYRLEPESLPLWRHQHETRLPQGYNPKTVALAREWRGESASEQNYINRVLNWYREAFFYTHQPPRLGRHTADQFLFETRRGFCEHFASSFVILMRAAGIPARVVAGYLGGELNPYHNYLLVHQYDAHAWAEVWLKGQGWLRVDPTAAVAPERIKRGLQALVGEQVFLAESPLSLVRYQNIRWLNLIRLQLDRLDYLWHRNVLAFDGERQRALLEKLLGKAEPGRIAFLLVLTAMVLLSLIGYSLTRERVSAKTKAPVRIYLRFCKKLEKIGLKRMRQESPAMYAQRVIRRRPDLRRPVKEITRLFECISYAGKDDEAQLRRAVRHFRPRSRGRSLEVS